MNRDSLESLLEGYAPSNELENSYRDDMLRLLQCGERSWDRTHYTPGHFTASCFVVDTRSGDVALIYHGKLKRWLQPGGHVEPDDADPVEAARRELNEETGWATTVEPLLFDLDIHVIPPRPDQPEHRHFDLRFLVALDGKPDLTAGDDAEDVSWRPVGELLAGDEPGMRRAAGKILTLRD